MKKHYANAKDVLPLELIEQIRKHYTGMLYISGEDTRGRKRQLIINLAKQGASTAEIAAIVGVSSRRVNQILTRKRRKTWEWIG